MKREEAIHFATCLKNNWTINFADMEEFCDMAIEALSVAVSREDTVTLNSPISILSDVAVVVRCKDCRWYGHAGCAIRIVDDSDKPQDDDYCSFGERKGGDLE